VKPEFNFPHAPKPRFCAAHKYEGMEAKPNWYLQGGGGERICESLGCQRPPKFNFPGTSTARFCADHKEEGMCMKPVKARVRHKPPQCDFGGCDMPPKYNYSGSSGPRFCLDHKEPDMVEVWGGRKLGRDQRCKVQDCRRLAKFNFAEADYPRFCADHGEDGMVDVWCGTDEVLVKQCEFRGCEEKPEFNLVDAEVGGSGPGFCRLHRTDQMVTLEEAKKLRKAHNRKGHKMCEKPGCGRYPRFNYPGVRSGRFCSEHRKDGMINNYYEREKTRMGKSDRLRPEEVKFRRCCLVTGCGETARFALPEKKEEKYCESHRLPGMVELEDEEPVKKEVLLLPKIEQPMFEM